jgi:uncharacterized protein (TIGR00251 family)
MRYTLFVKPGSKKGPLVELNETGEITVFVRERAVDGAANKAVIELLAKHFGVTKSSVEIESGFTGRHKRVRIG